MKSIGSKPDHRHSRTFILGFISFVFANLEVAQNSKNEGIEPASIGIDTWGVDFVSFGKDGEPLKMPYSYRDTHTFGAPENFRENFASGSLSKDGYSNR